MVHFRDTQSFLSSASQLKYLVWTCLHTLLCCKLHNSVLETMQWPTCSRRTFSACRACLGSDGHGTISVFSVHPSPAAWRAPPVAYCLDTKEDITGLLLPVNGAFSPTCVSTTTNLKHAFQPVNTSLHLGRRVPMCAQLCVLRTRTKNKLQSKHGFYVPCWTDRASPGQH